MARRLTHRITPHVTDGPGRVDDSRLDAHHHGTGIIMAQAGQVVYGTWEAILLVSRITQRYYDRARSYRLRFCYAR